jgi:decaprenylphospho-beta-D-erythro-pentofuranosid-2-ulose 2-reductase
MRDGLGGTRSLLVLGGDSDIGNATAKALIAGHTREVLLAGRNLDRLEVRAKALREAGATRVEVAAFDADDVDSHEAFFAETFGRFERFDVVLLAFGVLGEQAAVERDPSATVAVARTNYLGAASVAVHAAERLRRQGQGTLVVLSSVAAQRPRRSNFVYGSTKAGLDALCEGLAFALKPEGVQVLTVRPGFVDTQMTAGLKRVPFSTTPEAVGAAIVKAIARGDELIWTPRKLRYVMMVLKLVPRPIFRRLKL